MTDTTPRPQPRGQGYIPTVGTRLRLVLAVIFAGVALLGATGLYLAAITLMNALADDRSYTTAFTFWMFLVHVGIGILFLVPFVFFGVGHYLQARGRPNRAAVRRGLLVMAAGGIVAASGLALIRLEGLPQLPTGSAARITAYVLHVALPVLAIGLYLGHRRAGPPIRWRWGYAWAGGTVGFVALMVVLHGLDPRHLFAEGPREGELYFHPSEARTATGKFIPADVLMMDEYCKRCHEDIFNDHFHSAHRFSSFNNPPYLFSVRETREVSLKRDGDVKASRWCAGCHDPVPFFSGAFDDPKFDDVNHHTSQAGITCTVCHAMTKLHGTIGNAAYTIEEPPHYPFAFSDNKSLQWLNNQLVKAKPDFHKRTFLKPFHKSAEFCSTCHKVALPVALNHYKDFLRGQNHYDSFLLSGVSGHGARSFYYPSPGAKENCAACHMPLKPSRDFGSRDFDNSGMRKVHNHFFPAANTGLPFLLSLDPRHADKAEGFRRAVQTNTDFLRGTDPEGKDRKLRIDLFGLKRDGSTAPEKLIAPLRPELPALTPGRTYLVEVVVRNLGVGHHFSQGTVDSNEIWVDFRAESGGKVIARNGALAQDEQQAGPVDEWAHFLNVLMLDRDGNRINRRNPQDIFTPLYDHQIPPGSAQVVHYRLDVPSEAHKPIELRVRLRYRKFDHEYMKLVHKGNEPPILPIVDICEDAVTLPVEGGAEVAAQTSKIPLWQRWNDYGIGCLLEGPAGARKGHTKQAAAAFLKLTQLGVKDAVSQGWLNLARVHIEESNYDEAAKALKAAAAAEPPANWWSLLWFNSVVNSENATSNEQLEAVIADLEKLVDPAHQPAKAERGFDFSKDYVVLNRLANRQLRRSQREPEARQYLARAVKTANRVLALDSEDVEAHNLLQQCFAELGSGFEAGDAVGSGSVADLGRAGRTLADGKQPQTERLTAAGRVVKELYALGRQKPAPGEPRLGTYRELVASLNAAYQAEKDDKVAAGLAAALEALHRESHAAYKPDEIARSYTTRLYREKHKAANWAARDRVIYPTTPQHRAAIIETGKLPGTE